MQNKRKIIISSIIIIIIVSVFTITISANSQSYDFNNVALVRFMGYTSLNGSLAWREINYTIENNGNTLVSDYCTYSQLRERIQFTINNISNTEINSIHIETDIYFISSNNDLLNSTKTAGYNLQIGYWSHNNETITWLNDANISFNKKSDNLTWKVIIDYSGKISADRIALYIPITFISANMYMDNITFSINNESYIISKDLNNISNEIEDAISEEESMIGELTADDIDLDTIIDPLEEILVEMDDVIVFQWFQTSMWTPLISLIVGFGLAFALIAFILFGRKA